MLEKQIEAKIVEYAKSFEALVFKLSSPSRRGIPDRLFLYKKRALFLETKRPGNEPTALQYHTLKQIRDQGFPALWVDNFVDAKTMIDTHLLGL